jgi:hypothetical protein
MRPQALFFFRPKVVRNIGIACFILSFFVPAAHFYGAGYHFFVGCGAFIRIPFMPFMRLTGDDPTVGPPSFSESLYGLLFCGLCWGSWAANFSVFFRLPFFLALIPVTVPWIAFIWVFPLMTDFFPFYFWAFGIALIHLSRLQKRWPKSVREAIWFKRSSSIQLTS